MTFADVTEADAVAVRLPEVCPATPVSTHGWAAPATVVLLAATLPSAEPT
jgi:hypothetical protein